MKNTINLYNLGNRFGESPIHKNKC